MKQFILYTGHPWPSSRTVEHANPGRRTPHSPAIPSIWGDETHSPATLAARELGENGTGNARIQGIFGF